MDKVVVCSQLPRSRDWKQFDFKHINSYARWYWAGGSVWHWGVHEGGEGAGRGTRVCHQH